MPVVVEGLDRGLSDSQQAAGLDTEIYELNRSLVIAFGDCALPVHEIGGTLVQDLLAQRSLDRQAQISDLGFGDRTA